MCIHKYFTNLEIELGANILGGDLDTLFGSFKENDQLFLRAKYYFWRRVVFFLACN